MLSAQNWVALLVSSFCSFFFLTEAEHQFLAVPRAKYKIPPSSNLTINCSTNDANASTAVYFKRKGINQNNWTLLKPGVDHIVQIENQVYLLINAEKEHKGQYQCRAWKGKNGAIISWPLNVGKLKITKGKAMKPKQIPLKKVIKSKVKVKPVIKKNGKKKRQRKKKLSNRRNGKKRHGFKRKGKKRPGFKKRNKKRQKGVKKSGKKRPPKVKKVKVDLVKKPDIRKPSIRLKTSKTKISAIVGRNIYINCVARYFPSKPKPNFTITWYKDGKALNKPHPSHLKITTKSKVQKRKVISLLRIERLEENRDKGVYQCKAVYANGQVASSLAVQLTPKT